MWQNMGSLMHLCHMCVLQRCFAEPEPLKLWGGKKKKKKTSQNKRKPQGSRNDAANTNVYFCRSTSTDPLSPPWYFSFMGLFYVHLVLLLVVAAHLGLLWAMVKGGGGRKSWPNELLLVTHCAFLCRRALQSSSITGAAQHRWAAVGPSSWCGVDSQLAIPPWHSRTTPRPPVLAEKPVTHATGCRATAVERRPNAVGQVIRSGQVEQAGSGAGRSSHWAGLVELLSHICKDGWGERGFL